MPKYFPIIRTVVEEVETSTGTDVTYIEDIYFSGEQISELVIVEDLANMADELAGLIVVDEDDYDLSDSLEVSGTSTADESITISELAGSVVDVPEPILWVTEPPSLNPDVADFYRMLPRIADSIADVGEVVAWDPVGVGLIEITTNNVSGSGRTLTQIQQNQPDSSFTSTPSSNFQNDFRFSNNAVSPNERMLVSCIRLSACQGITFESSIDLDPTIHAPAIRNTSGLLAANATFWCGLITESVQPHVATPTWNNMSTIRARSAEINDSTEQWHSSDIAAGQTQARGVPGAFASISGSRNLWIVMRQFESVLNAVEMRCDLDVEVQIEFSTT